LNQQLGRHNLRSVNDVKSYSRGRFGQYGRGTLRTPVPVYNIHEPNKPKTKTEDQPEAQLDSRKADAHTYGVCGYLQKCQTCKKYFVWIKEDGKNKIYAVTSEGLKWKLVMDDWKKYERFVYDPNSKPAWVCEQDLTGV
jgi:hypothetical protein